MEFEDDDVRVLRVVYAAGKHAIENLGDAPFELVLVELKKKPADPPR